MISHQRVHTTERPFTCVICKENFKTKEVLLKHKWVHTGLKPLQCHHCGKEFRVKERYERHMVECHNEIVILPDIYIKMPAEMVCDGTENLTSSVRGTKSLGATNAQTEACHLSNNQSDLMSEKGSVGNSLTTGLDSVVPCGTLHLTSTDSGQMQLSYPLLSSDSNIESEGITLRSVTNQITSSGSVAQTIDVESLLQDDVVSTDAIMLSKDGNPDVLATGIHESIISDCNEVVILNKATKSNDDEFCSDIDPSSTINIWMSSEGSVVDCK